jgi:hypothetical protein
MVLTATRYSNLERSSRVIWVSKSSFSTVSRAVVE